MSDIINGGVWVGRCDMCGSIAQLHLAGEFVICDDCEKSLRAEEE